MPLSELPMTAMVALFLAVFVLIGIYPALKRIAAELRKQLDSAASSSDPFAALLGHLRAESLAGPVHTGELNDYEIIVLRRIAQAGGKPLSRKQVNAPLLFTDGSLDKALQALYRRSLIQVQLSSLFGQRFVLSDAGRRYATEQGYIIQVHEGPKPRRPT